MIIYQEFCIQTSEDLELERRLKHQALNMTAEEFAERWGLETKRVASHVNVEFNKGYWSLRFCWDVETGKFVAKVKN